MSRPASRIATTSPLQTTGTRVPRAQVVFPLCAMQLARERKPQIHQRHHNPHPIVLSVNPRQGRADRVSASASSALCRRASRAGGSSSKWIPSELQLHPGRLVLGDMSVQGDVKAVRSLTEALQVRGSAQVGADLPFVQAAVYFNRLSIRMIRHH